MISRLKWSQLIAAAVLLFGVTMLVLERKRIHEATLPEDALPSQYFANQFIEIKIPGAWECRPVAADSFDSICSSKNDPEGLISKITLSASFLDWKKKTSLSDIQETEKKAGRSGQIITTKVRAKQWVDSGLMLSPNRVSRTLKTIEADMLVTVTFEADPKASEALEKIFEGAIRDLSAFRKSS